jgi:hypothetical protein
MSVLGQKQTGRSEVVMSAYPQKQTSRNAVGMSALCQKRTLIHLFDYLVGELRELPRHS